MQTSSTHTCSVHKHCYQSCSIGDCRTRWYRNYQSSRRGNHHTRWYRDYQSSKRGDCHTRQHRDDQKGQKGYFQGSNKFSLNFNTNERFSQSRLEGNNWSQSEGHPSWHYMNSSSFCASSHRDDNENVYPRGSRNLSQDYRRDRPRNYEDDFKMARQCTNHYPLLRGKNKSGHYQRYVSKGSKRNLHPACRKKGIKSSSNIRDRRRSDDVKRMNSYTENAQSRSRVTVNDSGEYLSGSTLSFSGSSASSDILHSPGKKQLKPMISGTSNEDWSIASKAPVRCIAETQQRKDQKVLCSDTKDCSSAFSGMSSSRPPVYSVTKLLLNNYQRGEVDKNKLHRTLILSTASNLTHTSSCCTFNSPQVYESLENMTYMEKNKGNDQLLCMWSFSGTSMQQIQLVNVKECAKTQCGELALELNMSGYALQSWSKITSLCWVDCLSYTNSSHILYTTVSLSNFVMNAAYIRTLDPSSGVILNSDFLLEDKRVSACAWNAQKEQFSAGLRKESKVVDVTTRQCWKFDTCGGHVLTQAFSKEDGGNSLFSGTHRGSVLMHDLRRDSRKPVELLTHFKDICHLRLSPDECYIYTSDIVGQIKRWDLRMRRTVMNYEGLCNQYQRLPFHIDDSQSVLYAAGSDCYTKTWCLQSGQLLQSIAPPYEATPNIVPAIQFSSNWTGVPGNRGLIMGTGVNFHLYSSTL